MSMLKGQRTIEFKGGLEVSRITPKVAEDFRSLRIKSLWLACDHPNAINSVKNAVGILKNAGFTLNHLYCYCLIGKDMAEEENRMREVFKAGAIPFAQLFKDRDNSIKYSREWRQFQRRWARPAITKAEARK